MLLPVEAKKFSLRDYQIDVRSQVYDYYRCGIKSVLVYAPTGAGKTAIASKFIADAISKGRRVLFCVHRVRLVKQTQKTLLKHFGIESGIIWADYPIDYEKPVQIAMLQTLQHRELPPDIGLVIVDEAHTSAYYKICRSIFDTYSGGIWALSKCFFVGLSASPWRSKTTEGFCQFFGAIARAPYPQQLIESGYLCRARQFGYNGLIDYSKLDVSSLGDYTLKSMQRVCTPQLNDEVVEKYLELCPQRKAIAFCASVNQSQDLAAKFSALGITSAYIVADTPEEERVTIFEKFASGEIQIITSVCVLCEGFDEPSVEAVILARPTRSRALLVQMCGRGLRLHPSKEDCWLVDFCENISRMGFPTNRYPTPLCPTFKRSEELDDWFKECPNCHAIVPKPSRICPNCGYVFPLSENSDIEPEELPPFGEIFSLGQKRQAKYYRKLIVWAFKEEKPRLVVEEKFTEKYNYNAPPEWAQYAVFNNQSRLINYNQQIYLRYLLRQPQSINGKVTAWTVEMMQLEFGERVDCQLKRWWEIFQEDKPFNSKEEMDDCYKLKVEYYQYQTFAHDLLALLNLAYDEGLKYYLDVTQKAKAKIEILYSLKDKPKALAAAYLTSSSIEKQIIENSINTELKEKIDSAIVHHWDSIPVA
ncbi:DEAD/DEAH box helicase [Hassallia byssoidea VB512170]|uniref:DEAD/DEAH box helicase n=1 Tax=Hassallia byssoidea VB512170 TaxID=1304833 RepID=A0A846H2W2_9CYAN|nr:DEAD/DEAH box helicase [Hassalia byssoidea]NEU71756.1 DEAD/DEAH box helicase [Hassalia byssoidea VB512170]